MNVNMEIVAVILFVVVVLIIFLIRRNQKDKREYEQEIIDSETKAEKHDEDLK